MAKPKRPTASTYTGSVTVLRRLDTPRKNRVLQFLRDAELLGVGKEPAKGAEEESVTAREQPKKKLVALLEGAYLRGAPLMRADLRGAKLYDADLRGADLSVADLQAVENLTCKHLTSGRYWATAYRDEELACGATIQERPIDKAGEV